MIDNPWDTFEKKYALGTVTDGTVVRIIEKGLIAELPDHVDGFVPATHLSTSRLKNIANHFPVDNVISLTVIEFDKENKKIVLSAISTLKDKTEEEVQKYLNDHKLDRVSVQSIKNSETGTIDSSEFPIFEVPENQQHQKPQPIEQNREQPAKQKPEEETEEK